MMHDREKSHSAIIAAKPNKAGSPAAEPVEPRAGTKRNAGKQSTHRTQGWARVTQALDRVRQAARLRKEEKLTALFHHLSVDLFREAFFALKRDAAPGVDGLTWETYEADLERNLTDLHSRVQRGAYRALPSRRAYIPKADGKQRPLAVAALDALIVGISTRRVNFIFDADVASFFDSVSKDWLVRFVEHRIGDKRIIRLIRKWLKAGVLEDGVVTVSEMGTGQGSVISPLLANIYMHYVFDLWAHRWRRREAQGDVVIVRYADDFVVGFEYEDDARRFWDALRARLEEFALSLHPDKTRLIEFGRHAADRRARAGLGKPETFTFLGFLFVCGKSHRGQFLVQRKSRRDRMQAKLKEVKQELRKRMHQPIPEQGRWLAQVVRGYFAYHAVPTNRASISAFRRYVVRLWHRTLRRRSQKDRFPWERMPSLADDWLPQPRNFHPWPHVRFAVRHSR